MKKLFFTLLLLMICINLINAEERIQGKYFMDDNSNYINHTIFVNKLENNTSLISEFNILQGDPVECYEAADSLASSLNFITGGTMSYQDEYKVFIRLYDVCMQGANEY